MKKSIFLYSLVLILISGAVVASNYGDDVYDSNLIAPIKKSKKDPHENYNKMMDVIMSPRCINCHPNDHVPKQADDGHPHYFGIARGENNHGFQAINCATCHQNTNNDYSGVPGAPEWSLAPAEMFWEGLSRKEIAESMMDPVRNGGRTAEETMHHLTEHELVLWAWQPGIKADGTPREIPPVPLDEYKKAVKAWIANGAVIPEN